MEAFAFSFETTISSMMNTAIVSANVVNDQSALIETKEVAIELNSETYKRLNNSIGLSLVIPLTIGILLIALHVVIMSEIRLWQIHIVNHTNPEQFKTDAFQIQIMINAYMVITVTALFCLHLHFTKNHGYPRPPVEWSEWLLPPTMFAVMYLMELIMMYAIPDSVFALTNESARKEPLPYALPKLYLVFQIGTIWFILQSFVGFAFVLWDSDEKTTIKTDKTAVSQPQLSLGVKINLYHF